MVDRGGRDGLATGVHDLAAQLVHQLGDLRDLADPADAFRYELPRIGAWLKVVESRDATCRTMDEAWF